MDCPASFHLSSCRSGVKVCAKVSCHGIYSGWLFPLQLLPIAKVFADLDIQGCVLDSLSHVFKGIKHLQLVVSEHLRAQSDFVGALRCLVKDRLECLTFEERIPTYLDDTSLDKLNYAIREQRNLRILSTHVRSCFIKGNESFKASVPQVTAAIQARSCNPTGLREHILPLPLIPIQRDKAIARAIDASVDPDTVCLNSLLEYRQWTPSVVLTTLRLVNMDLRHWERIDKGLVEAKGNAHILFPLLKYLELHNCVQGGFLKWLYSQRPLHLQTLVCIVKEIDWSEAPQVAGVNRWRMLYSNEAIGANNISTFVMTFPHPGLQRFGLQLPSNIDNLELRMLYRELNPMLENHVDMKELVLLLGDSKLGIRP